MASCRTKTKESLVEKEQHEQMPKLEESWKRYWYHPKRASVYCLVNRFINIKCISNGSRQWCQFIKKSSFPEFYTLWWILEIERSNFCAITLANLYLCRFTISWEMAVFSWPISSNFKWIKSDIETVIAGTDDTSLQGMVRNMEKWLELCLENDGAHIEHLLHR